MGAGVAEWAKTRGLHGGGAQRRRGDDFSGGHALAAVLAGKSAAGV
jgi:hypothetical protein